jgi:hypothetical protein
MRTKYKRIEVNASQPRRAIGAQVSGVIAQHLGQLFGRNLMHIGQAAEVGY